MCEKIGKISNIEYGLGGYQGMEFGLSVTLMFKPCEGVKYFKGMWEKNPEKDTNWSMEDQKKSFYETSIFIKDLLKCSNKTFVSELKGMPVSAVFQNTRLVSWRILEEVI